MPLPTLLLPGYLAGAPPYLEMEMSLRERGIPVVTVPLRRRDWLPTLGGRSMVPILEKLHEAVEGAIAQFGSDTINLVGHSAGGWIARVYLGEVPYDIHPTDKNKVCCWKAHPQVKTLVTLGTPHRSQERWTKRNLDFVNNNYPGAFHSAVKYVCVAGKAVYGERRPGSWFTYSSYEMTGGRGDVWGDGITPVDAAHLAGAENITLGGVLHSPRPGKLWYGSPEIVQIWAEYLV